MNKEKIEKKINDLRKTLKKWDEYYFQDDLSNIDDSVYDEKLRELFILEEKFPEFITSDSPTQKVGSLPSSSFKKTNHKIIMLSLKNAFNYGDLKHFDKQIKQEIGENFSYFVEPKIDGLSLSLIYENGILKKAITRGDGKVGEDVTNNALQINNLPKIIDYKNHIEIRGEVYIPFDKFKKINLERINNGEPPLANPRNAASGSMRQLDVNVVKGRHLKMLSYWAMIDNDVHPWKTQSESIQSLHKLGFEVSKISKFAKTIDDVITVIEEISEIKNDLNYEIDGIVIKVNDFSTYIDIGSTSKFPKWAIAYKFPAETKQTILEEIFPTIGRTGRVTYNAKLKEVEIGGTKVQRATLHNAEYIQDLDLRVGDLVEIKKAGEIIPKVIKYVPSFRDKQKPWKKNTICLSCGSKLIQQDDEVDQYCINKKCPSIIKESIIHFASRDAMNIEGLSEKQIEKFINLGWLKDFSDIYKLEDKREEILELDGYQKKSVNSLFESINKTKQIPLDKFIFALGIRHIGKKTASDISRIFGSIEKIKELEVENLMNQHDLGGVKSNSIIDYFNNEENLLLLEKLLKNGVKTEFSEKIIIKDHPLFDKKIVISGTIDNMNRQQVKEFFENLGAKVTTTISKKTDYLIIGKNASESKKLKIENDKIVNFEDINSIKTNS